MVLIKRPMAMHQSVKYLGCIMDDTITGERITK